MPESGLKAGWKKRVESGLEEAGLTGGLPEM